MADDCREPAVLRGGFELEEEGASKIELRGTFTNVSSLKRPGDRIQHRFPSGWLCAVEINMKEQDEDEDETLYLWLCLSQTTEAGSFKVAYSVEFGGLSPNQMRPFLEPSNTHMMTWTSPRELDFGLGQSDKALGGIKTYGDKLRVRLVITSTSRWKALPRQQALEELASRQFEALTHPQDVRIDFECGSAPIWTSSTLLHQLEYFDDLLEPKHDPASERGGCPSKRKEQSSQQQSPAPKKRCLKPVSDPAPALDPATLQEEGVNHANDDVCSAASRNDELEEVVSAGQNVMLAGDTRGRQRDETIQIPPDGQEDHLDDVDADDSDAELDDKDSYLLHSGMP